MKGLIDVSDELCELSKQMIDTIEQEDKEYEFKINRGYIERNVLASKFKKNIVGLTASCFEEIISDK